MSPPAPTATASAAPLLELVAADIASAQNPELPLVRDVHWRLSAGDYWAVGGLDWAGKSDWLTTVAGLQRPAAGRHLLFGEDSAALTQDELVAMRLRLGLVFENGGRLFAQMTVAENISLPMRYHHNCLPEEAQESLDALLALTGLRELAHQPASQLNRGWRQRVALARALILRPDILLLDNPLAGLDPRQVRWWLETLDALNAGHPWLGRPLTLVATTDDLRLWQGRARRYALLSHGQWRILDDWSDLAANNETIFLNRLSN